MFCFAIIFLVFYPGDQNIPVGFLLLPESFSIFFAIKRSLLPKESIHPCYRARARAAPQLKLKTASCGISPAATISVFWGPACVFGGPVCVFGGPVCVFGGPVCIFGGPLCVFGGLVCVCVFDIADLVFRGLCG